jgi:hypothetical protein
LGESNKGEWIMGRGPSYPFINLEEAIAATKKIYDFTKRTPADTDSVVSQALRYSLKSSGGVKTIAALKSYGLIDETDQGVRITDRAYRILIDIPESIERKQAIKEAALSPKWYQTVFEKWGVDPPASTRSTLILQHGFVPTTVDSFLKGYSQTIVFAELTEKDVMDRRGDSDGSLKRSYIPKIGEYVQWESKGLLGLPEAKRFTGFTPDGQFGFVEGSLTGLPVSDLIPADPPDAESSTPQTALTPSTPKLTGGTKMQTETFALPEGVTGQLQWPSEITAEAFEDFVYQLEGMRRRVARAVKKPQSESDVTSKSES